MQHILDNAVALLTAFATAVAAFVSVRIGLTHLAKNMERLSTQVEEVRNQQQLNDARHDSSLADHDKRIALVENTVSHLQKDSTDMKAKIDKMYEVLVRRDQ